MVFTEQDGNEMKAMANTQEKKELVVRMFASALIQGTTVTAPEMNRCLQSVINSLQEVEVQKVVIKKNTAV